MLQNEEENFFFYQIFFFSFLLTASTITIIVGRRKSGIQMDRGERNLNQQIKQKKEEATE